MPPQTCGTPSASFGRPTGSVHGIRRVDTLERKMANGKKLTPEEEENRLDVRVSALDWFMHPVPEMRCRPAHEQAPDNGKRLEEMKAMLRSCPVSTVSRFIKASDAPKPVALNQKKWVDFPLEQRIDINHNTRRLRFRLPVEHLGLPVGMHIFLKGSVDGKAVMRAYTPVLVGPWFVDFIIKVYFPMPPKFPDGGVLTQHMERRSRSNPNPNPNTHPYPNPNPNPNPDPSQETLKIGDTLAFKGPLGHFDFDCAPADVPRDTLCTFTDEGKAASYRRLSPGA